MRPQLRRRPPLRQYQPPTGHRSRGPLVVPIQTGSAGPQLCLEFDLPHERGKHRNHIRCLAPPEVLRVQWRLALHGRTARQMMRRDRKPGSIDCPGLSAFNPSDGFQLGLDFLRLFRLGLRAIGWRARPQTVDHRLGLFALLRPSSLPAARRIVPRSTWSSSCVDFIVGSPGKG